MIDYAIIPECFVDTNLIETLVPPRQGYNHQKGCGTVTKVMQEKFANDFAVGIVDKDKQELDYLRDFDLVLLKGSIEIHKHKARNHYIIRIVPAVEKFILQNVQSAGITLEDFGLPSDFDQFKKLSKSVSSKKDDRFRSLFRSLKKANLPDVQLLISILNYLIANPYSTDINVIKAM